MVMMIQVPPRLRRKPSCRILLSSPSVHGQEIVEENEVEEALRIRALKFYCDVKRYAVRVSPPEKVWNIDLVTR
jgi:hypothetical protein